MNFMKKVFEGKTGKENGEIHLQFQKFSRGEFRNRALISAKKSKSSEKYTIKTSPEFGNGLVKEVAKKLGSKETLVKGAIVSTLDLKESLQPKDVKQFRGVKRYLIQREMSGDEVLSLLEDYPKAFFGLSFKTSDGKTELKIKPKAPKSGKPGSKGEKKPKANFCTLKTTDKELGEGFVFESDNWNAAEINHTFFIDKIIIPGELKDETDYKLVREKALRKGRIVRDAVIDGETIKTEKEFLA